MCVCVWEGGRQKVLYCYNNTCINVNPPTITNRSFTCTFLFSTGQVEILQCSLTEAEERIRSLECE